MVFSLHSAQFTKQQIQNYLLTGDPNTAATAATDLTGYDHRMISYAIIRNPTAVYAFIQANYGKQWGGKIAKGLEYTDGVKESMDRFLKNISDGLSDADKANFAASLFAATPHNPKINNWTVPIN